MLMPGIANLNVYQFHDRVNRFAVQYVNDWRCWLNTQPAARARQLGAILRRWQACRPNSMRRTQMENMHDAPYLEDLVDKSKQYIRILEDFDISEEASFSDKNCEALNELWHIFQNLSYRGPARNGLAGVVGITKAILLLTDGRVGPAFDSKVRGHLGVGNVVNADQWIAALQAAHRDIVTFEQKNKTTILQATPQQHVNLNSGRIYDMALGPGA